MLNTHILLCFEGYHEVLNVPHSTFCGQIVVFSLNKINKTPESNALEDCHFVQMPQKSFVGLPWPKLVKLAYFGVKNAHFGSQKCSNLQQKRKCFAPNSPKNHVQHSHSPKKFAFLGAKLKKAAKNQNAPKSHLEVSNDQNLHFLWAKTGKKLPPKMSQMPPKVIWRCPMTKMCIFCGPKLKKKKMKKYFCPKCHQKSFGGVQWPNFPFLVGQKCPKMKKKCQKTQSFCLFKIPPKIILGCLIIERKKKWPKNPTCCLPQMPQKLFGSLQWPTFAYLGAKLSAPCCYQYSSL